MIIFLEASALFRLLHRCGERAVEKRIERHGFSRLDKFKVSMTSEKRLNLKSILDLGKGPQSGTAVAKGVKSGDYGMTVKDNQVYVTKNTNKKSSAEKKLEDMITNVRKKMW